MEIDNESELTMDETDIAHLAGYVDAQGRITVHVIKNDDYSTGYELRPSVRITIPREDEALVGKFMAYCEANVVQYTWHDESGGGASSGQIDIKTPEAIRRFLRPLAPHLVATFDDASLLVEGVLPGIEEKEHHTPEGLLGILDTARPLRSGGPDRGHTIDELAEEFGLAA